MTGVAAVLIVLAQAQPAVAHAADNHGRLGESADLPSKYQLRPNGSGGYRWQGPGFVAKVDAAGAVQFEDERPLPAQTTVPVRALAQAVKDANGGGGTSAPGGVGPRGPGTGGPPGGGFLNALGRNALKMITNPTLVVSDEELRRDPHHAAKMDFVEGTAKFRERLRLASDRKNATGALGQLRRTVQAIAADQARPVADRHRLVFELWDECEDSPAGSSARQTVEEEAGRQFAAGSPSAFSSAELATFNTGQTTAQFSPYRAAPAPRR
jgi:hypothetical protein